MICLKLLSLYWKSQTFLCDSSRVQQDKYGDNASIWNDHSYISLIFPFHDSPVLDIRSQFLNKFYHLQFRSHFAAALHDSAHDERGRDELHAQFIQLDSSLRGVTQLEQGFKRGRPLTKHQNELNLLRGKFICLNDLFEVAKNYSFEVDIEPNGIVFCALPHKFVEISNLSSIKNSILSTAIALTLSYRFIL